MLYDHALALAQRRAVIDVKAKRASSLSPDVLLRTLNAQSQAFAEYRDKLQKEKADKLLTEKAGDKDAAAEANRYKPDAEAVKRQLAHNQKQVALAEKLKAAATTAVKVCGRLATAATFGCV